MEVGSSCHFTTKKEPTKYKNYTTIRQEHWTRDNETKLKQAKEEYLEATNEELVEEIDRMKQEFPAKIQSLEARNSESEELDLNSNATPATNQNVSDSINGL